MAAMIYEDQRLPPCPLYHPLSDLKDKSGCYPNISDKQLVAAKEVSYVYKCRCVCIHIHSYMHIHL
jgi:hypothetical protein